MSRSISKIENEIAQGRRPSWEDCKLFAAYLGTLVSERYTPGEEVIGSDGGEFSSFWDDLNAAQKKELRDIARRNAFLIRKGGPTSAVANARRRAVQQGLK